MKISLCKKHLGSLSSLLLLSLIQPSANAEAHNTGSSSTPIYDAQSSDEERAVKGIVLRTAYHSYGSLNISAGELKHVAYKSNISQAFEQYYAARNELEEHYQDKIDQVLDEYEQNLKLAANVEQQTQQAKQSAKCVLAELKQQHQENQAALKLKYHIS